MPKNRVDSRFWVASRLSSSASEPSGVDSLPIGLGTSFLSETNCFRLVTRRIISFPEVEITSLALTRKIIPSLRIPRETIPFLKAQ